ncbi:unnamed protein product, partial [Brassica oleracea]
TLIVKQKNARNMRKAILLSKRSSALSQDKGPTSKPEENLIVACTKCG